MSPRFLNWPALAGATALALAAALTLLAVPRWHADTAQADEALRQRARAAKPLPRPPAPPSTDRSLALALPAATQLPERIAALVQQARLQGLRVDSVRQQPPQPLGQDPAALDAERVPLRLAGMGPYSAWRRLVAQALQQDDALVLTELRLARSSPSDPVLSGTLQWSLLQGQGDPAGEPAPGRGQP